MSPRLLTGIVVVALVAAIAGIAWYDHQDRTAASAAKPTPKPKPAASKSATSVTSAPAPPSSAPPAPAAADNGTVFPPTAPTARAQLAALIVASTKNSENYARDAFGPGWSGSGTYPLLADGCTARDDVLKRDLADLKIGDRNTCIVFSGTLTDPYTGKVHPYSRYAKSQIELDHVVALGAAWRSGAWSWTPERRQQFANDTDNLLAVDKKANQDKSSKTPDQWMPPNGYAACPYAQRWVGVKTRYGLTVTRAEHDALARILAGCA